MLRRYGFFWSLVTVLAVVMTTSFISLAQTGTGEPQGLFTASSVEGSLSRRGPEIIRKRFVTINFDVLGGRHGKPASETTMLNLFDNAVFKARLERFEPTRYGHAWVGHIEGVEFSDVVLVAVGNIMAGGITMPGANYGIEYAGNGVHAIYQINPQALPPEEPPISPPVGSIQSQAQQKLVPAQAGGSVIDLMVVYTPAARAGAGGTAAMQAAIDLMVSQANQAYLNSGITQRLRLVHTAEVVYTESGNAGTDLARLQNTSDGYMDEVHAWRGTYGADLVSLIVETPSGGVAYLMTSVSLSFAPWAFSVVGRLVAGAPVLAHELGHNMGAHHDWYVSAGPGAYTYSHGHVNVAARFKTIMGYYTKCFDSGVFDCAEILYFSNPNLTYNGAAIGVSPGTNLTCTEYNLNNPDCDADNRLTLNNTAATVASFRASTSNYPVQPSNLVASIVSSSQINLSWTDNSNNETGFKIERKTGTGGTYSQIATVGADVTAYSDTIGLNPNTQYCYRVRAYNGSGDSAYSNESCVVIYFSVNSTGDPGDGVCDVTECTLREAINAANSNPGADTIQFNIPGAGPHTIQPTSALPAITDSVVIDGYTQPGASPNTNPTGALNTVLKIELNGSSLPPGTMGLVISASNSTVKGLVVNRVPSNGIWVPGNGNKVTGNFIGTDATGTSALANGGGIGIGEDNNTIGGTMPAERNLISGNSGYGLYVAPNGSGNQVQGNLIGTQKDGISPLGNGATGVFLWASMTSTVSSNTIAYNNGAGVDIRFSSTGNRILNNSIFSNIGLGIDLALNGVTLNDTGDGDTGDNNLQNFPVLTSATSGSTTTIQGTLNSTANTTFGLEFFSNPACDPTGYGEGQTFLGSTNVTTDGSGNASFTVTFSTTVPAGQFITATATDPNGNTSEFSQCIVVTATGTAALFRIERATGNVFTDGSFNPGGADIAERIDVSEPVEPGDVVELDPQNPKHLRKARAPYSSLVAGVISTKPGIIMGNRPGQSVAAIATKPARPGASALVLSLSLTETNRDALLLSGVSVASVAPDGVDTRPLLALIGRVPVKATTENGPIQIGDLLTSSSRPGYAMRCGDVKQCEGAIIGKALESLEQGTGVILMLIMR